jgi:hypothetical protein
MSRTCKSPKAIVRAALRIGQVLPVYSHRFSPQKFTQPQLFACLVLKEVLKTDYRGLVAFLEDCPDLRAIIGLASVPHFTTLHKASKRLLRLSVVQRLLDSTLQIVRPDRHVKLAAMDSTGLEAHHISHYFVSRRRSKQLATRENTYYKRWPKLAILCDCPNHAILSVITARGPGVDVDQFCRTLEPATRKVRIDVLLADAGYDSEANHRYARDTHQIESIIPPTHGRPTRKVPSTPYRRRMRLHFRRTLYRQRWQAETVISMLKRNYGSALRARSYWSQCREMLLLVLTHNTAIILCPSGLFYRACQVLFQGPPRHLCVTASLREKRVVSSR